MRFKCSQCGHVMIQTEGDVPLECIQCHARLRVPSELKSAPTPPQPVVIQFNQPAEPFEFYEEKKADLKERREDRQESRQYRREDRLSNPMGLAGFAINVTTLLLLLSSWMFAKSLPAYLYIAASLAIPAALGGASSQRRRSIAHGSTKGDRNLRNRHRSASSAFHGADLVHASRVAFAVTPDFHTSLASSIIFDIQKR